MSNSEIKREKVKIDKDNFDDFTGYGPWEIDGETYEHVETIKGHGQSDGEDNTVIIQRKSDNKFFKFFWWYHPSSGDYIFEDDYLEEVFKTIKITYK